MWQVIFAGVLFLWMYLLSRDIIRAAEHQGRSVETDDILNTAYPVFSRKSIVEAHRAAVETSKTLQRIEQDLYGDSEFTEATKRHAISESLAKRMLEVTEAIVEAEKCWYRHSVMMEANIGVFTGKTARDEALAMAQHQLEQSALGGAAGMFDNDARNLQSEWKVRLENTSGPEPTPSTRRFNNPWADRARQEYHW